MTLLAAVMVVCANAQSTKSIAKSAAKAAGEAALSSAKTQATTAATKVVAKNATKYATTAAKAEKTTQRQRRPTLRLSLLTARQRTSPLLPRALPHPRL